MSKIQNMSNCSEFLYNYSHFIYPYVIFAKQNEEKFIIAIHTTTVTFETFIIFLNLEKT